MSKLSIFQSGRPLRDEDILAILEPQDQLSITCIDVLPVMPDGLPSSWTLFLLDISPGPLGRRQNAVIQIPLTVAAATDVLDNRWQKIEWRIDGYSVTMFEGGVPRFQQAKGGFALTLRRDRDPYGEETLHLRIARGRETILDSRLCHRLIWDDLVGKVGPELAQRWRTARSAGADAITDSPFKALILLATPDPRRPGEMMTEGTLYSGTALGLFSLAMRSSIGPDAGAPRPGGGRTRNYGDF